MSSTSVSLLLCVFAGLTLCFIVAVCGADNGAQDNQRVVHRFASSDTRLNLGSPPDTRPRFPASVRPLSADSLAAILRLPVRRTSITTKSFPLFKQCDPLWGYDEMGGDADICREGCAMSSVSMALNGFGIPVNGQASDPGVLNKWLLLNHGYHCLDGNCNNMVLESIESMTTQSGQPVKYYGEIGKPDLTTLQSMVERVAVIAHVRDNSHFVLLTGFPSPAQNATSTTFFVNDPGFNQLTYDYTDMSDVIAYDMN